MLICELAVRVLVFFQTLSVRLQFKCDLHEQTCKSDCLSNTADTRYLKQ